MKKNLLLAIVFIALSIVSCKKDQIADYSISAIEDNNHNINGNNSTTSQCYIAGTVRDKVTSERLFGVGCIRKSNLIGTLTDGIGDFTIAVPIGTVDTLVFIYPGYQRVEKRFEASGAYVNMGTIELQPAEE